MDRVRKRRCLSRREMLALSGVFGAALLFGLVPGATRAFALAALTPTRVTDITNPRAFLGSNTIGILNGELIFSKKPSEFDEIEGNEVDSYWPFHWAFKENFQFQWSQDGIPSADNVMSNKTMFSGWCLVPNASDKKKGVLNVCWDSEHPNYTGSQGDSIAPPLMLTVNNAGYDSLGRPLNLKLTLDVSHVLTGANPRLVDKTHDTKTSYIPVLVWANNLSNSAATTGTGRGPTFWLADGLPSKGNVVALSLVTSFEVTGASEWWEYNMDPYDWPEHPTGDFVVNCVDMDQPSWWAVQQGQAQSWNKTTKYVESLWVPAPWENVDDPDAYFSYFTKAYCPPADRALVTPESYSQEWCEDHWDQFSWSPSTLNVRWSGKNKGVSEDYDRNIAILVATDTSAATADDISREYYIGWQGSGCKSILSFGFEAGQMHFVETRIVGGLGRIRYPNGDIRRTKDPIEDTNVSTNRYFRKYYFTGATPGAYGIDSGAVKSDGKPPYTFTPAAGWRIEYLRYRKYTAAQNGAWTNVDVGDGTEAIVLFERPNGCGKNPFRNLQADWQCEVKFVENVGKLRIYKHDAETSDHTAQGDGVLGGNATYAGGTNPGATFKVWRKDGSEFLYGGTKVREATAKVSANSPTAYAEFDQIEVGDYYWQETAAPDGYRIDTARHEVTITAWRQEGDEVVATCSNYIKRGGVRLKKIDFDSTIENGNKHKIDLDWGEAQGNATLAGAEFKVFSTSAQGVKVNNQYFPAQYHHVSDIKNPASAAGCLLTLVTDANGEVSTANNVLPYGTYAIFETKPPSGYLLNEAFAAGVVFTIREDGGYVQFNGHEGYLT